jgi:3-keto-disaccharide hydrolase
MLLLPFPAFAASADPTELFDGKSLAGWEGDTEKTWKVEDGAIVGGSLDEVTFKLSGDKAKGNAGIQFRTRRIPKHHEVSGYQADIGQDYWGALYDESRRNKVLTKPARDVMEKLVKHDDWNEYVIRAEGPRIRLWLNGTLTVDYTEEDEKIEKRGIIGLQIHGGAKAKVYYKNITIEELSAKK